MSARFRRPFLLLVLGSGLGALGPACSLIVEHKSRQCDTDADCKGFAGAVCDVSQGVCAPRAGDKCVDPSGCWACAPTNSHEFQTACTDAVCVPFDNGVLAGMLEPDGGLPAIP